MICAQAMKPAPTMCQPAQAGFVFRAGGLNLPLPVPTVLVPRLQLCQALLDLVALAGGVG
jgi:hypothetical protein